MRKYFAQIFLFVEITTDVTDHVSLPTASRIGSRCPFRPLCFKRGVFSNRKPVITSGNNDLSAYVQLTNGISPTTNIAFFKSDNIIVAQL